MPRKKSKNQKSNNKKIKSFKKNSKSKKHQKNTSSSKEKLTVKKSFTLKNATTPHAQSPFLVFALFACAAAISIILYILLSQFVRRGETLIAPPSPHQLSTITSNETFLTVKNSLLQNSLPPNEQTNTCLGTKFFQKPLQTTTLVNNKFLVILKRGKLFVTNSTTNKFVSSIEISPIPIREQDAISYHNLSLSSENTLVVTGYRAETSALEITTFSITSYGKITRGETYNLATSNCNFADNLKDNKLTFYTSKKISPEITLENINLLNQWSTKLNKFNSTTIKKTSIFYDNASLLENPIIHTVTTCQIKEKILDNCQQRHLISNDSSGHYLSKNNFYLWTTQTPSNNTPGRVRPGSRLFQFDLSIPIIKMTEVEGVPISRTSLFIDTNELFAKIYQNNSHPPAWHTNFTKNKIANFAIPLDEFQTAGSFINSTDNYTIIPTSNNIFQEKSERIISTEPILITLDESTSTINIAAETPKILSIDGKILNIKQSPNKERLLVVYKNNTTIFIQSINTMTHTTSTPLILQENINGETTVELSFFYEQKQLLSSVTLAEAQLNKGSIYLLNVSTQNISLLNKNSFNKTYQRTADNCQNDCTQSWSNQAKYFNFPIVSTENKNKFVYATVGSRLKKFIVNNDNTIKLLKTIDYTYKPAPPKPKRPAARVPGGAKVVNGKYVCKKKKDYVGKSKKNNKGYLHLDMECCLDPDEYPNPWCTYRPGELGVTKLRYKDYHGKKKVKKH